MGDDEACVNAFLNWTAFIWQLGRKPQTAWVFHGRTGTGKGMLFRVLRALFGRQALTFSGELLSDRFNGRLAQAQLLLIDEIDSDQIDKGSLAAKLRSWITEETLPLRGMRVEAAEIPSFFGVILASNNRLNV